MDGISSYDSMYRNSRRANVRKHHSGSSWLKTAFGECSCSNAAQALKKLSRDLWQYLVRSFIIPHYRPEWGRYRNWDTQITPARAKVRASNKTFDPAASTNSRFTKRSRQKTKTRSKLQKKRRHATDVPPRPVQHNHSGCITVRINVSGKIFETQHRTLKQFPETLLGDPRRLIQFYDPERDEYFFDRHRSCFEAILYYYLSGGIIRRPSDVPLETFMEEIKFFDLGQMVISSFQPNRESSTPEDDGLTLPKNLLKRKLWLLFEHPTSSYQSRIVAFLSILAVVLSIFEFCIETLPSFANSNVDKEEPERSLHFQDSFFFTETICIVFFTVEYLVKAATCPHFFNFLKNISNLIDLVSIMPYFLGVLFYIDDAIGGDEDTSFNKTFKQKTISLTVFRIIRLVRVFRILKLSRHNRGLRILGKTLKASFRELGLLIFFLAVGVVLFSSAMYFAEHSYEGSPFQSIPGVFWFAVVTMTTLGYGDEVPLGTLGKIVGALCAIAGVLTISLPVPVIVSNFNMFYNSEEEKVINPETAAISHREEYVHVEHCPYYPAWYGSDGQVLGEKTAKSKGATDCEERWLVGEQKPDHSDSDFDVLKQDEFMSHPHRLKKGSKRSSRKKEAKKNSHKFFL